MMTPAEAGTLAVLHHLSDALGLPFDPTRAANLVRAACRDIPPTSNRAARRRLAQAAELCGIRLLNRQMSAKEALRAAKAATPLAAFTVGADGHSRWFVLSGDGVLLGTDVNDPDRRTVTAKELADAVGASSENTLLEWFIPIPIENLSKPDDRVDSEPHGVGHGHAHAHVHLPPLTRLIRLLRPEKRDLWIVVLYAVTIGVLNLAAPLAAMAVVNSVALATLVQQLIITVLALLAALTLSAALQALQAVVVEYIQRRLFARVADDLAYRLPRVAVGAFDRQDGPELVNRFFDVLTVQKAGATLLLDGVTIVLQMVIGLLLLAFYDPVLLGFDIVLIAALLFLFFVLGRGAVRCAVNESVAKYSVAAWMEEVARNPSAFKTAGAPQFVLDRADLLVRDYLVKRDLHFRVVIRQFVFALFLQAAASSALLAIGGYLVMNETLSLGQLVAAQIVVSLVVATFSKLGKQLESYYDLLAATDKLGYLFDLPLERGGGATNPAVGGGARLAAKDVAFTYDGGHHPALEHFSVTIAPGERVALVGPSGSGKSTFVDLIFGTRSPDHGRMEFDGFDLRELDLPALREQIAVVKGVETFTGTILANIRMGRDYLTVGEVREALDRVDLLETILDLPDGLNTILSASGAPLSQGQANRLMLARAVAGGPRLLVLDEVLDNMDEAVRSKVFPAVFGPDAAWTLLVVTHSAEVRAQCGRTVRFRRGGYNGPGSGDTGHGHDDEQHLPQDH